MERMNTRAKRGVHTRMNSWPKGYKRGVHTVFIRCSYGAHIDQTVPARALAGKILKALGRKTAKVD